MGYLKAHELRNKKRSELNEELATLEKKLFELRGQKAASSSGAKLNEIRVVRRDVARVKTVLMEQQRDALKKKYSSAKLVPKDLREYKEKSVRNQLAAKWANKKTAGEARRAKFLHPIKFALKSN